jgi:hypothetical protein
MFSVNRQSVGSFPVNPDVMRTVRISCISMDCVPLNAGSYSVNSGDTAFKSVSLETLMSSLMINF